MANESNASLGNQGGSVARLAFTTGLALAVLAGIVANVCAIGVSVRSRMSSKIQMFYVVMMATDLLILMFVYFVNDVLAHGVFVWSAGRLYLLPDRSTGFCKFQSYLFFSSQFCSNYIVLLLSLER